MSETEAKVTLGRGVTIIRQAPANAPSQEGETTSLSVRGGSIIDPAKFRYEARPLKEGFNAFAKYSPEFLSDLKNFNPATMNQGVSATCVASGEIRSWFERDRAGADKFCNELIKNGSATIGGMTVKLEETDFAKEDDRCAKNGFDKRILLERVLERAISRAVMEEHGRGGDNPETGLYDHEIMALRSRLRGDSTVRIDKEQFKKLMAEAQKTGDYSALRGITVSMSWLPGTEHECHYFTITDVRDGRVIGFETWGKKAEGLSPKEYSFDKASGLGSFSIKDFENRVRVGFISQQTAEVHGLAFNSVAEVAAEVAAQNAEDRYITGFDIDTYNKVESKEKAVAAAAAVNLIENSPATKLDRRFDASPASVRSPVSNPNIYVAKPEDDKDDMSYLVASEVPVAKSRVEELSSWAHHSELGGKFSLNINHETGGAPRLPKADRDSLLVAAKQTIQNA